MTELEKKYQSNEAKKEVSESRMLGIQATHWFAWFVVCCSSLDGRRWVGLGLLVDQDAGPPAYHLVRRIREVEL